MPPPTRAKSACVDAPIPKVSIVVVITTSVCASEASCTNARRIIHQMEMSSRPRPTTVRPITAPLRKAICRPPFSERIVALAVRADAYVAVRIPT